MVDVSDPESEAVAEEATETPTAPAPPAIKKTVEAWAEAKGLLPQFLAGAPARAGSFPVAPRHNAEFWRFAGARALLGWPEGAEVTEAEFDSAIEAASKGESR